MSKPVKRKRPGPKRNFKPEVAAWNEINSYQKALRELVKTGGVTDDALAARIEAGWHPGHELAIMSARPDLAAPLRIVILKTLLENVTVSAVDRARLDAAVDSPTTISISIAGWAAGQGPKAVEPIAIEHRAVDVDYVANDDAAHAHRGAPPPPPQPEQPAYQEMELRPDGGGVLRPAPVESKPEADGWRPKKYIFDPNTATYIEEV